MRLPRCRAGAFPFGGRFIIPLTASVKNRRLLKMQARFAGFLNVAVGFEPMAAKKEKCTLTALHQRLVIFL